MAWCENDRVGYVLGMARNQRSEGLIAGALTQAQQQFEATQFAHKTRSGSWSKKRRVVAKAGYINGKSNPRIIVTSLRRKDWEKQKLYEE